MAALVPLQTVSEVLNETTVADFVTGANDLTRRDRPILGMLESKSRMLYDQKGTHIEKRVRYKQRKARSRGDGGNVQFERSQPYKTLKWDWRDFYVSDRMTYQERLQNGGRPQIIDRYAAIVPEMLDDIRVEFCSQIYSDGHEAGNESQFEGIMTLLQLADTSTYSRAANDLVIMPDGFYGQVSTAVGSEGGKWSSEIAAGDRPCAALGNDWPEGHGDSHYDYNSPKYVRYNSPGFRADGSTVDGWGANFEAVARFAIQTAVRSGGREGRPDLCVLPMRMLNEMKQGFSQRQRIDVFVTQNEMTDYGFADGITFEGVYFTTDFDSPPTTGLLLNTDHMEFRCLTSEMFDKAEPKEDVNRDILFDVGVWGNWCFDAKFQSFLIPD